MILDLKLLLCSYNFQVLCLNYNHIESIVPKTKAFHGNSQSQQGAKGVIDVTNPESNAPVLEKLEVLHLG